MSRDLRGADLSLLKYSSAFSEDNAALRTCFEIA